MTLAAIDEAAGLWTATKQVRTGWRLNTTLVRLDGGGTLAMSPTGGLGDDVHAAIAQIGAPEVLLAPNHFHYLGVAEWRERYPNALVVASDQARMRLAKKCPVEIGSLDAARERLSPRSSLVELPGCKSGEVWVRLDTAAGAAWCVTDAFFHEPDRASGLLGFILRATKTTPGLCLGKTFPWLALSDKRAYTAWLYELLDSAPPAALVPAHGVPLRTDDLAERLRALAVLRLGG